MEAPTETDKTAYIILNPVAGIVNPQVLRRVVENRFRALGWQTRFHVTEEDENTAELVAAEIQSGVDLVVSAGGDGTIASVAAGMVGSEVPLGIIPTGTWNAIARHLTVPFNPIRAVNLMTGAHEIRRLDLMRVGDTIHAMNIGVGFSASMVANTTRTEKRRLGNIAYFSTIFKQIFGLEMRRYSIDADGKHYRGRATEIFVANYGMVGLRAIENVLDIKPDDGKVDVLILRARTILDLPVMFWQAFVLRQKRAPKYRQLSAASNLVIRTNPPASVQADGELVGMTPISVTVLPQSVNVIVPQPVNWKIELPINRTGQNKD